MYKPLYVPFYMYLSLFNYAWSTDSFADLFWFENRLLKIKIMFANFIDMSNGSFWSFRFFVGLGCMFLKYRQSG